MRYNFDLQYDNSHSNFTILIQAVAFFNTVVRLFKVSSLSNYLAFMGILIKVRVDTPYVYVACEPGNHPHNESDFHLLAAYECFAARIG